MSGSADSFKLLARVTSLRPERLRSGRRARGPVASGSVLRERYPGGGGVPECFIFVGRFVRLRWIEFAVNDTYSKTQSSFSMASMILKVLRNRRSLIAGVGLLIVAIASAMVVAHWQTREQPHLNVTVLSYTNVVFSTNDLLAGKWIRATLELTNQGSASVSYLSWGSAPYGSVAVETSNGWTNRDLALPFTGWFTLVRPKSSVRFSTLLPADSIRWTFGFRARTASARERATWKLIETSWMDRLGDFNNWWIWILSDEPGPAQVFQSDQIEIQ